MRNPILPLLSLLTFSSIAASEATPKLEWTFTNAKAIIASKGSEPTVSSFTPTDPISSPLTLTPSDSLKLSLIIKAGGDLSIPHQAFLYMKQVSTGIETFWPFNLIEESAKARLEIAQKDIPLSFVTEGSPVELSVVVSCFTPTVKGLDTTIGMLNIEPGQQSKVTAAKEAKQSPVVRYEALPEIRHTFRPDPKSPPKIITLVFTVGVLGTLLGLFGAWAVLSANVSSLPTALKAAPISHPLFFGSILAMEGIFFMYYIKWNLFQTLLAMGCVAPVGFLSGSRALTELRERRVKGG